MDKISSIKYLRSLSGHGMMDCKRALIECDWNMDKSIEYLKTKGNSVKRSIRLDTTVGYIATFKHSGNRYASMVEFRCETDYTANLDNFKNMADIISKSYITHMVDDIMEMYIYSDGGIIPIKTFLQDMMRIFDEKITIGKHYKIKLGEG